MMVLKDFCDGNHEQNSLGDFIDHLRGLRLYQERWIKIRQNQ